MTPTWSTWPTALEALSLVGVNLLALMLLLAAEWSAWRRRKRERRAAIERDAPAAALEHDAAPELEQLIALADSVEASERVLVMGSDAWWKAWAESGGSLPQAAGSCRPGDGPKAA